MATLKNGIYKKGSRMRNALGRCFERTLMGLINNKKKSNEQQTNKKIKYYKQIKTNKMKIENLANNQVIVHLNENNSFFSSYGTIIAKKENGVITLDEKYWNYSGTTTKYLSQYLGVGGKKDIEKNISEGIYKLNNLN